MRDGSNKVVIVTGGSRGIGRATSLQAAKRGWRVCIGYVSNDDAAEDTVRAIKAAGSDAIAVRSDVASEPDILRLFAAADSFGKLGALVNNAGVTGAASRVENMDAARIERILRVNVLGSFLCSREAVKRMATSHGGNGGVIVNISSIVARLGAPNAYVDYAATKAAIDTLTLGLAQEVATDGIRVVSIRPGLIDTEIHAGSDPDRLARLGKLVPMQRIGEAEEVANGILWLMSNEAAYITGTTLDVSGGR